MNSDLQNNLSKLHTTELGIERIKKNLSLDAKDVIGWCRKKIEGADSIIRKGKNWYVDAGDCIITVNADSLSIITAHIKAAGPDENRLPE